MHEDRHILDRILETKKLEVNQAKKLVSIDALRDAVNPNRKKRSLKKALFSASDSFGIIAEVKKKSPSKGLISNNFNPALIATQYESAGAVAISVLTDEQYFGGSAEDLKQVRQAVDLPILRKDFIIDEYQLLEAASWGADVILLISRILDADSIEYLSESAEKLGLEVLFEIHDLDDLKKISHARSCILGINNRNLQTFEVSLQNTVQLMREISPDIPVISESGIASAADISTVKACGVKGALIGESFMKHKHPGDALRKLIEEYRGA